LVNFALVERDEHSLITLHDLLHRYTHEHLGDLYVQTHLDFLASYGITGWHQLSPDEPYLWRNLAYHLIGGGQTDRLYALLTDYHWLQAKLDATDSGALEADCAAYLAAVTDGETAQTVRLIQSALSMSGHVLAEDKTQLPYQLTGRLWAYREKAGIAELWQQAQGAGMLMILGNPRYAPMEQAGGSLIRTFVGHTDDVKGFQTIDNSSFLSWSKDTTLRIWSITNGQCTATLSDHRAEITGALVLGDGRIVSWSQTERQVCVWQNGACVAKLAYPPKSDEDDDMTYTPSSSNDDDEAEESENGQILTGDANFALEWSGEELFLKSLDGKPKIKLSSLSEQPSTTENRSLRLSKRNNKRIELHHDDNQKSIPVDRKSIPVEIVHTTAIKRVGWSFAGRVLSLDETITHLWSPDGEPLYRVPHIEGILAELADGHFLTWKNYLFTLWSREYETIPDKALKIETQSSPSAKKYLTDLMNRHMSMIDVAELSDGRLLSWSNEETSLRLWSSDGQLITTLTGHTDIVNGARQLPDGRLLSWSTDRMCLWSSDGQSLVSSVEEWDDKGKKQAFITWAAQHLFHAQVTDVLMVEDDGVTPDLKDTLEIDGGGTFTGDYQFTTQDFSGQTLVVGDAVGRVIFLRVRDGG
jgi:WD40 repeat protein